MSSPLTDTASSPSTPRPPGGAGPLRLRLFATLLLAVILLIFRLPAFRNFFDAYVGGVSGDAGLYVWLFRSHVRGLFSTPWFDTNGFYPYGQSLAWSDNFILPGILGKLGTLIGLSEVAAYNVITLGSTFLAGYCTFGLAFRLTQRFLPALCAGVSFMTLPFISGMQGHPQLVFTFFIPLGVSQLVAFLHSRSLGRAFRFGLVITVAFATTVYYAIFLIFTALTLFLALLLVAPGLLPLRAQSKLGIGALLGALPLLFLVPPYLTTAEVFGERNLYETFYFAASALSFLSAPPGSLLYGATSILSHDEAHLFPGFIMLAVGVFAPFLIAREPNDRLLLATTLGLFATVAVLSVLAVSLQGKPIIYLRYLTALCSWATVGSAALLLLRLGQRTHGSLGALPSRDALTGVFLLLALMSFLVALGPLGNPEHGQLTLGMHRLWYEILPGFDAIRAISRIGILTLFALSVLLALVLANYQEKGTIRPAGVVFLVLLLLGEHYHPLTPHEAAPTSSGVYQRLAQERAQDSSGAVIALPLTAALNERGQPASFGEFARRNIEYLLKLFPSGLHAVNGYSGQRTKIMRDFPRQLARFPDERSVATLCTLGGVRYLVFASAGMAGFDATEFMQRVRRFSEKVTFVDSDTAGNYLFALPCRTRITAPYELLIPGNLKGSVEMRILADDPDPSHTVTVTVSGISGESKTVLTELSLPGGNTWQKITLSIPRSSDPVRPLRLSLSPAQGAAIVIEELNYRTAEDTMWLWR